MVVYSRDQLITLDRPDLHVPRDVRKAIFGHALQLPQSQRDWNSRRRHERDASNVNNPPLQLIASMQCVPTAVFTVDFSKRD